MSLAFVFPGQGAQSVGMLNAWDGHDAVQSLIASANAAMVGLTSEAVSLSELIKLGPAEALGLTVNTQPAMLLAAIAAWQAWQSAGGPQASVVAGHSLGEYSALVAAGSLSLSQALPLVRLRAQAMQEAVPVGTGGMAAILGLTDEAVLAACTAASNGSDEVVAPANFNAPSQVVIAGHAGAVQRACEAAKAAGAKRALPLAVSAPFHSQLLKPAGDVLSKALAGMELKSPTATLVNNVDVATPSDPVQIKDALVRQAYSPVRWVEVVQKMRSLGVTTVIEFGPGKVLTGLVPRIEKDMRTFAVFDPATLQSALDACK